MQAPEDIREAINNQVVNELGETRAQLTAAFDRVLREGQHWKDPIDAVVQVEDFSEVQQIDRAITFFTGSVASVEAVDNDGSYRIRAAGYYAAVGA